MKPLVIYHADCTDGFGAAFAAWLKFGNEAEYLPVNYKDVNSLPKYYSKLFRVRDKEVYILDFNFPRDVTDIIFKDAKRVVWLDHHKSAFEMWTGLYVKNGIHIEHDYDPDSVRPWVTLDDNKSGALLAWEFFHPGTEVPMLIRHIDDRDRWQFKLEGSKEIHATLASMKPWSFEQWKREFLPIGMSKVNLPFKYTSLHQEGAAILRAQDAHIQQMLKQMRRCEITLMNHGIHFQHPDVFQGLALNTPMHMSEVGHELANRSGTYGLVWYMDEDNRVKCSLRSNGDYDVSAIAKAFGGGGHKNAAGFEVDIQTLLSWIK